MIPYCFFETGEHNLNAHTSDDVFQVKMKLFELEEILPRKFVRVSKSAIVNVKHIYSVERNITSASLISFAGTHKQLYASRSYYKLLKLRLGERRFL
nr:LytTR family DNA-binding domain-containing protein [Ruminococcus bicirculans (ex Wegman et al. 2014)]